MTFADRYIEHNRGSFSFYPPTLPAMDIIVVIPCYNEPDIGKTIRSLSSCINPGVKTGIVVVLNSPEGAAPDVVEQNKATLLELEGYKKILPGWLGLYPVDAQGLPPKHAGAGWARKIGMDWATGHFNNTANPDGLIASLDADTVVDTNYFTEILQAFQKNRSAVAATTYFEHPLDEGQSNPGIACYELYMRYYRNALLFSGFTHALYTLGSCFVVKAGAYVAQGGMNRRKAGEDFYFLHKLLPYGEIGEINTTTVYPSARISNRVPFGTGPALQKMTNGDSTYSTTYPLEAFLVLNDFFGKVKDIYLGGECLTESDLSSNPAFQKYSIEQNLVSELVELGRNCSSAEIFRNRFFHIFNAFRVLKWLNYAVKNGYPKKELLSEAGKLLKITGKVACCNSGIAQLLLCFREIDRNR